MSLSLFQTTHARLRGDILSGRLAPGQRLRLEDLHAGYGASVPTLREVLNRLASEGLVVSEDQRGFAVAPISAANLLELAGLRKLIEGHALELSFRRGTVAWESEVVAAHHKLSRIENRLMAGEPADRDEWKRYDFGFHQTLIAACGSGELLAIHRAVFDKYLRYQMIFLTFRGAIAAKEHKALLEAALTRDIVTARAVLDRHVDGGVQHALAAQGEPAHQPVRAGE
ncbi:MAG: GntR family transcriptional regulator [Alphaproteobacteria bacterium HGW-Alphaproteobacteria-6]|nr:MAG: GntR family transcriptional regulator [Alphaproteobacteria bacterium HGW-Alphaproteobacteria-6]